MEQRNHQLPPVSTMLGYLGMLPFPEDFVLCPEAAVMGMSEPVSSGIASEGICVFAGWIIPEAKMTTALRKWPVDSCKYYQPMPVSNPQLPVYRTWYNVSTKYTIGGLSFATDKLTAISGLARDVQECLRGGDEYAAGLWKDYLHEQLL